MTSMRESAVIFTKTTSFAESSKEEVNAGTKHIRSMILRRIHQPWDRQIMGYLNRSHSDMTVSNSESKSFV